MEKNDKIANNRINDIKSKLWWAVTFSISTLVGLLTTLLVMFLKG